MGRRIYPRLNKTRKVKRLKFKLVDLRYLGAKIGEIDRNKVYELVRWKKELDCVSIVEEWKSICRYYFALHAESIAAAQEVCGESGDWFAAAQQDASNWVGRMEDAKTHKPTRQLLRGSSDREILYVSLEPKWNTERKTYIVNHWETPVRAPRSNAFAPSRRQKPPRIKIQFHQITEMKSHFIRLFFSPSLLNRSKMNWCEKLDNGLPNFAAAPSPAFLSD